MIIWWALGTLGGLAFLASALAIVGAVIISRIEINDEDWP